MATSRRRLNITIGDPHPRPLSQREGGEGQRGAALIVVLLLVATLSFILVSVTNVVTASVKRAGSERARSELLWRAFAAEEIAAHILANAASAGSSGAPAKMARGEGIFDEPVELPFERGEGQIAFFDATRCFNVNNLSGGPGNFADLLAPIGIGSGQANKLAAIILDFVDTGAGVTPQGAEDDFYTLLPTPFRTADHLVASVSELRAMDGVTAELYRRIRPLLCARTGTVQPAININMLLPEDAPLAFALLGAATPIEDVRDEIKQIPPGAYSNVAAAPPALRVIPNAAVTSDMIEARVRLELDGRSMEEILLFQLVGAGASAEWKLLARSFGEDY